jgi:hypothetical protein
MSDYCLYSPTAQKVAYTATPGVFSGYTAPDVQGQAMYKLITTTDAWVAQGIDDTAIQSGSASADTLTTAAAHKLTTGMPVQVAALGDTAVGKAFQVTAAGPTFVDLTTAANNATANDVQPFPTGEVAGDYFAVGYATTFGTLKVVLGTSGTVGTLTWEYWNGTAWTALSGVTDNTTQFKAAPGTYTVVFTVPNDWAALNLNAAGALYYVRAKVATSYTVDPLITQVFIDGVLPTGLSASTTYWAIVVSPTVFKLATSRANALAGTAIDLTTNGGGVTATTVATNAAGSAFVPAKVPVDIDGSFGAKISVIQDASGGNASLYPVIPTR